MAAQDPLFLPTQQLGDGGRRELILAHQRFDDPALVNRTECALRRVRLQEHPLVCRRWTTAFDDDRNPLEPRQVPVIEAPEAIDDLEPLADSDDPNRQFA
jgi:hypothetical protein